MTSLSIIAWQIHYIKVVEKHALYSNMEFCIEHDYNMLEAPPMLVKSHYYFGLHWWNRGFQKCMYNNTHFRKYLDPKYFEHVQME